MFPLAFLLMTPLPYFIDVMSSNLLVLCIHQGVAISPPVGLQQGACEAARRPSAVGVLHLSGRESIPKREETEGQTLTGSAQAA